jgi:hypothetical protein
MIAGGCTGFRDFLQVSAVRGVQVFCGRETGIFVFSFTRFSASMSQVTVCPIQKARRNIPARYLVYWGMELVGRLERYRGGPWQGWVYRDPENSPRSIYVGSIYPQCGDLQAARRQLITQIIQHRMVLDL